MKKFFFIKKQQLLFFFFVVLCLIRGSVAIIFIVLRRGEKVFFASFLKKTIVSGKKYKTKFIKNKISIKIKKVKK